LKTILKAQLKDSKTIAKTDANYESLYPNFGPFIEYINFGFSIFYHSFYALCKTLTRDIVNPGVDLV